MPDLVSSIFSIAWHKVAGTKKIFWIGICLYLPIIILLSWTQTLSETEEFSLYSLLFSLVLLLFNAGLYNIGIKCAQGKSLHFQQMFSPLQPGTILRLVVTAIVKYIITMLPIIIFILLIAALLRLFQAHYDVIIFAAKPIGLCIATISLVYLQIRMMLSTAFILDRHADFWSAIQLSFKATQHHTWPLFLLSLGIILLIFLSIIPFGIGLIWSIPFGSIVYGELYQKLVPPAAQDIPKKRVFNA